MKNDGRARRTIAVFAGCLFLALGAVLWISILTLDLVDKERTARAQAALEENVRLALWRMDSQMAPLIARESARPYFTYSAFYPAERAYAHMFESVQEREVLLPSPLVSEQFDNVLLHFQVAPGGAISSPEAPAGSLRALARDRYVSEEKLAAAEGRLGELRSVLGTGSGLLAQTVDNSADNNALRGQAQRQAPEPMPQQATSKGSIEWFARSQRLEQASRYSNVNAAPPQKKAAISKSAELPDPGAIEAFAEGPLTPLWTHGALLLARRIRVGGLEYVQGCWLDWPKIKRELLLGVADLLPRADLIPNTGGEERRLASLPVQLVPGPFQLTNGSGGDDPGLAVKIVLAVAWCGVLLAAAAVAALMLGTMALSERRAAFVSAVTHELRTPLTTFRMYSEMLAENMVADEAKRRAYVETLKREAVRLSHLVENVLAYARIERGRQTGRIEDLDPYPLLERFRERLSDRASQANMALDLPTKADSQPALRLRADPAAVDQILFNLVDNACKYAQSAADKRIHLEIAPGPRWVSIRVVDHGPGVPKDERAHLFSPFSKSAQRAANSAPGVGLGLALSRELARTMGGDLVLESRVEGAAFRLDLLRV